MKNWKKNWNFDSSTFFPLATCKSFVSWDFIHFDCFEKLNFSFWSSDLISHFNTILFPSFQNFAILKRNKQVRLCYHVGKSMSLSWKWSSFQILYFKRANKIYKKYNEWSAFLGHFQTLVLVSMIKMVLLFLSGSKSWKIVEKTHGIRRFKIVTLGIFHCNVIIFTFPYLFHYFNFQFWKYVYI